MSSLDLRAKAVALRDLHRSSELLVLPNAWDCLSARLFEQAGFPAVATTSGGIAAVFGYPDGQHISARAMLEMAGRIAASVSVPVTADLEAGYGGTVAEVVEVMREAMAAGLAGANLEDGRGPHRPLAEMAEQIETIKAIRQMAGADDVPFVLNARVDVYLYGAGDAQSRFSQAVQRANAYREAGADCLFLIGVKDRETIAQLVREIHGPVNIMATQGAPALDELRELGVARVTFGSGLMRAALPLIRQMAEELLATGASPALAQTEFTHLTVNQLFNR